MCNPQCPRKTDAELAQAARRHLQAYAAAVEELQRRGFIVKMVERIADQIDLEIYTVWKENL